MESNIDRIELISVGVNTITVISEEMLINLRSALYVCHKVGFAFDSNNNFIGMYGEAIIFSIVNNRQEQHVIKIDQEFESNVRKIQYGE